MAKIESAYDVEAAFAAIEEELIASMMRNMKRHRDWEDEKGFHWSMWQAEQLQALERYKKSNSKKFQRRFEEINGSIRQILETARVQGGMEQEIAILEAIENGWKAPKKLNKSVQTSAEFFKLNTRKLEALIQATENDFQKGEIAILRRANDQYRQIIFNTQVYANTGAGTYENAVDMAARDFLAAGINCIEYKNGARHTMRDYASMAIRTGAKRAYLAGEGEKRQEWGISTVIINKRGNPCLKCLPFVGKVMIDDVWSGGKASDGAYPLLSSAIAAGLYHPNCKDSHTTYFPGVTKAGIEKLKKSEMEAAKEDYIQDQKERHIKREAEKYDRLASFSLDRERQKRYAVRREAYKERALEVTDRYFGKNVTKPRKNDTINKAKGTGSFQSFNARTLSSKTDISIDDIRSEMNNSPVGKEVLKQIDESDAQISLLQGVKSPEGERGSQQGKIIKIYLDEIPNTRVAAQTIIHEMTHSYYDIGGCQ